jgi:hypothetical protein
VLLSGTAAGTSATNIVENIDKSVGALSLAALESGLDMHYR